MRGLGQAVAWRFVGTAAASSIQFANYVLLARVLGVAEYGVFFALFAAGSFAATLTGAGFTHRALRLQAEATDSAQKRSTMIAFRLTLGIILAALVIVLGPLAGLDVASCLIASAFVLVDAATDICQAALAGERRLGVATVVLIGQRVLMLLATVALAVSATLIWFPILAITTAAVYTALTLRSTPRFALLIDLVRTSRAYWSANLAASLSQLEVPVIALVGGPSSSGLYAAGSRAGGPVNLLAQALLHTATPELSAARPEARLPLFRQIRRVTWIIVAVSLVIAVPGGFLCAWLFGAEYRFAWPIVAGFIVGGALMGVNQAHQALLFAVGHAALVARSVALGATTGLLFSGGCALWLPVWTLAFVPIVTQGVIQVGLSATVRRYARTREVADLR